MTFIIVRYRIEPAALGFHIRLRVTSRQDPALRMPKPPKVLTGPVGWALTEAGAHRKARRIIRRLDRREQRRTAAKEYDA